MQIWVLALVMGWIWGSFCNQCVDRLFPTPLPFAKSTKPRLRLLQPLWSICESCQYPLAWRDNIPVLSWIILKGCCRQCGVTIGKRTLVMELSMPLLFLGWTWLIKHRSVTILKEQIVHITIIEWMLWAGGGIVLSSVLTGLIALTERRHGALICILVGGIVAAIAVIYIPLLNQR